MIELSWLQKLHQNKAIAVIRCSEMELGLEMARAVADGGIQLIEITWNSEEPVKIITKLRSELPACTIGAGTLLSLEDVQDAIASGAQFLFTPHVNLSLIQAAVASDIPIVPGALTPTEIVTAWQAGASCVKVFPIQAVGGASYLKCLQGPLGQIPLIPTGGVTLKNAREFIEAGAVAVGLSGELFPKRLVTLQNWEAIAQLARTLRMNLQ